MRDSNFCTARGATVVNQPRTLYFLLSPLLFVAYSSSIAALTATSSKTDAICHGSSTGTMTVVSNGGTGSHQYRLEPNYEIGTNKFGNNATFTKLRANLYQVTVQDGNGCQVSTVQTVSQVCR